MGAIIYNKKHTPAAAALALVALVWFTLALLRNKSPFEEEVRAVGTGTGVHDGPVVQVAVPQPNPVAVDVSAPAPVSEGVDTPPEAFNIPEKSDLESSVVGQLESGANPEAIPGTDFGAVLDAHGDSASQLFDSIPVSQFSPKITELLEEEKKVASDRVLAYVKKTYEDKDFDYSKITYVNNKVRLADSDKTVLVLLTIGGSHSYGKDKHFADLLLTINSFEYENNLISLSFSVGDVDEFRNVERHFDDYFNELMRTTDVSKYVSKVTLLSAPFIEKGFTSTDRTDRHSDHLQRIRRRQIARSRNFNLLHGLDKEKYTLFLDADIVRIEHPEMLRLFVESKRDIIVPRIKMGVNDDYDRNSWRGPRTKPDAQQLSQMDLGDWGDWNYVPKDAHGMYHFQTFVDEERRDGGPFHTDRDYVFPLDSVGGAVLFLKSVVYKQGIVFPTNYIIGTTWDRAEGYDGIETEGLCYVAKLLGYECWGMPNVIAHHDNHNS